MNSNAMARGKEAAASRAWEPAGSQPERAPSFDLDVLFGLDGVQVPLLPHPFRLARAIRGRSLSESCLSCPAQAFHAAPDADRSSWRLPPVCKPSEPLQEVRAPCAACNVGGGPRPALLARRTRSARCRLEHRGQPAPACLRWASATACSAPPTPLPPPPLLLQLAQDVEQARRNVERFKALPEVQLVAGELRNTFGYEVRLRTTNATSRGYLRNPRHTFIVVSQGAPAHPGPWPPAASAASSLLPAARRLPA